MEIGFARSSSQAVVAEAVKAYRQYEQLMVKLSAEEKAQVYEKTPIHDMREWGTWE